MIFQAEHIGKLGGFGDFAAERFLFTVNETIGSDTVNVVLPIEDAVNENYDGKQNECGSYKDGVA